METKGIIFDLDGTLLDTLADIAISANDALEKAGFPTHDLSSYKYFVGQGVKVLMTRALPEDKQTESNITKLVENFRDIYDRRWAERTTPYPGVEDLLMHLDSKSFKVAVLSNKPDDFTKKCVEYFLDRFNIDPVMGQLDPFPHKPDPQSALFIARTWALNPDQIIFVGDTAIDMITANNAGMLAIGVSWGFRPVDELLENGAQKIVYNPLEIMSLL